MAETGTRVGVGVRPARGPHGRAVIDGRGGGPVGWLVVGRGHVLACSLGGSGGFGRLHLLPCSVGWGRRDCVCLRGVCVSVGGFAPLYFVCFGLKDRVAFAKNHSQSVSHRLPPLKDRLPDSTGRLGLCGSVWVGPR